MTWAYNELKEIVLGQDFPWFWHEQAYDETEVTASTSNFSFFSHVILERPGYTTLYPKVNSQYIDLAHKVFVDIAEQQKIEPKVIYRINANLTIPSETGKPGPIHTDHDFPHKNMIVYLTDCNGGATMVENQEPFYGTEDSVLIFEGKHQHSLPKSGRRVVLVYTFI